MFDADVSSEKFLTTYLPGPRTEGWQYTDLNALRNLSFRPLLPASLDEKNYKKYLCSKHYLVFHNGYLKAFDLPPHVLLKPLKNNTKITDYPDAFETLNQTHAPEPYVLTVGDDAVPFFESLHILYLASSSETEQAWAQTHLILNITASQKVRIIESFLSASPVIVNAITAFHLGPFADVDAIKIQREHDQTFHISQAYLKLARSARIKTLTLSEGARLGRSAITAFLHEENARCELYGFSHSQGFNCQDHPVLIEHAAPYTHSEQYYQGIARDKSRTVFNGKIRVYPEAHHALANQKSHYVMLSDEAEIDARPELEIYQDEVRCTHGAAIGSLDPKALFYLQTRGLDRATAQALLIEAFENRVLGRYTQNDLILTRLLDQLRK